MHFTSEERLHSIDFHSVLRVFKGPSWPFFSPQSHLSKTMSPSNRQGKRLGVSLAGSPFDTQQAARAPFSFLIFVLRLVL